ncbi:phosphoribosyltransferase [Streptomyces sp. MK7]|uniref:ComF family protein n=1 Tax=Streptomyces sp. MK7 TaxID=3067635 RepID=UPI00293158F6|nr:phosphoribosyltransferase [Streptomyces sp. MK7]
MPRSAWSPSPRSFTVWQKGAKRPDPQAGAWTANGAAAAVHAAALTWTGETGDIKGATILLVDDVLTSGSQLQRVALRLRASGAADVRGLVLARVPWSG